MHTLVQGSIKFLHSEGFSCCQWLLLVLLSYSKQVHLRACCKHWQILSYVALVRLTPSPPSCPGLWRAAVEHCCQPKILPSQTLQESKARQVHGECPVSTSMQAQCRAELTHITGVWLVVLHQACGRVDGCVCNCHRAAGAWLTVRMAPVRILLF